MPPASLEYLRVRLVRYAYIIIFSLIFYLFSSLIELWTGITTQSRDKITEYSSHIYG